MSGPKSCKITIEYEVIIDELADESVVDRLWASAVPKIDDALDSDEDVLHRRIKQIGIEPLDRRL
jgi:hypothetical protein